MERTDYDMTFSCPVCFGPSMNIVFGTCQHYICSRCLYEVESGELKSTFSKCPICKRLDAFPPARPVIPDSTRQLMKMVGVVECTHKRCSQEMWTWEQEQHENSCPAAKKPRARMTTPKLVVPPFRPRRVMVTHRRSSPSRRGAANKSRE